MGLIGDGKKDLAKTIEQEIAAVTHGAAELGARAKQSADDAQGLNGLASAFNGFSLALEQEIQKLRDAQDATLKKLGIGKEKITERTNPALVAAVQAAAAQKGAEA